MSANLANITLQYKDSNYNRELKAAQVWQGLGMAFATAHQPFGMNEVNLITGHPLAHGHLDSIYRPRVCRV
jgi:hypothetical protein